MNERSEFIIKHSPSRVSSAPGAKRGRRVIERSEFTIKHSASRVSSAPGAKRGRR